MWWAGLACNCCMTLCLSLPRAQDGKRWRAERGSLRPLMGGLGVGCARAGSSSGKIKRGGPSRSANSEWAPLSARAACCASKRPPARLDGTTAIWSEVGLCICAGVTQATIIQKHISKIWVGGMRAAARTLYEGPVRTI